jgi:hypothetical protein
MPQRTISEARAALREQNLSPEQRREKEAEVRERARALYQHHESRQDADEDRLLEGITEVKAGLSETADALHALDEEGSIGRLSAREYHARFAELTSRHAALLERAGNLRSELDDFEYRDAHRRETVDALLETYPILRPNFSF